MGRYKLLHRMQLARGFDGWCDVCAAETGCFVPPAAGPASNKTIAHGGQLCCFVQPPPNATTCPKVGGASPQKAPLPANLLYDVESDPSETSDLAPSHPTIVIRLLARLAAYNATNEP